MKHTPTPWFIKRHDTTFKIESLATSPTITEWRKSNPDKRQDTWEGTSVCELSVRYNGSGDKFGPHQIISTEEVEANAAIICHRVNNFDAVVEALENVLRDTSECSCSTISPFCSHCKARAALKLAKP